MACVHHLTRFSSSSLFQGFSKLTSPVKASDPHDPRNKNIARYPPFSLAPTVTPTAATPATPAPSDTPTPTPTRFPTGEPSPRVNCDPDAAPCNVCDECCHPMIPRTGHYCTSCVIKFCPVAPTPIPVSPLTQSHRTCVSYCALTQQLSTTLLGTNTTWHNAASQALQ
jgi:hypothetical protein